MKLITLIVSSFLMCNAALALEPLYTSEVTFYLDRIDFSGQTLFLDIGVYRTEDPRSINDTDYVFSDLSNHDAVCAALGAGTAGYVDTTSTIANKQHIQLDPNGMIQNIVYYGIDTSFIKSIACEN